MFYMIKHQHRMAVLAKDLLLNSLYLGDRILRLNGCRGRRATPLGGRRQPLYASGWNLDCHALEVSGNAVANNVNNTLKVIK
ncbi:hypothetical protein [Alcanivorax profundi]|uniref:hypothetical protein n=1 Tax=Alcanivorax profundi TaxID=2338368 RepID=UPI0032B13F27